MGALQKNLANNHEIIFYYQKKKKLFSFFLKHLTPIKISNQYNILDIAAVDFNL